MALRYGRFVVVVGDRLFWKRAGRLVVLIAFETETFRD